MCDDIIILNDNLGGEQMNSIEVIFWIACFVIFLIIEFAINGLVSVWFAVGAFASAIVALLGGDVWLQVVVFLAVTAVVVLAIRPFARKHLNGKVQPTNSNALIGKTGVVKTEIDNLKATGLIEVDGVEWTARSVDDSTVEAGAIVSVERIEGVKAIVKKN